jgi:micrococcal nuclease
MLGHAAAPESSVPAQPRLDKSDGDGHCALAGAEVAVFGVGFDDESNRVAVVNLPARLHACQRARGHAAPTTPTPAPPPDADSDGVPDASDACPTQYALTSDGCPPPPAPPVPPARTSFYAVVTAVVDGDTIRVRRGGYRTYTVRLIGIDTPETKRPGTPVECGGPQATSNMFRLGFTRPRDTNRDRLDDRKGGKGRRVKVTTDPTQDRRDRYGRLFAYVKSAQGSFAGKQLRAGWATVYVFEDPFEQLAPFQAAEGSAHAAGRGVWGQCAGNFHTPARSLPSVVD